VLRSISWNKFLGWLPLPKAKKSRLSRKIQASGNGSGIVNCFTGKQYHLFHEVTHWSCFASSKRVVSRGEWQSKRENTDAVNGTSIGRRWHHGDARSQSTTAEFFAPIRHWFYLMNGPVQWKPSLSRTFVDTLREFDKITSKAWCIWYFTIDCCRHFSCVDFKKLRVAFFNLVCVSILTLQRNFIRYFVFFGYLLFIYMYPIDTMNALNAFNSICLFTIIYFVKKNQILLTNVTNEWRSFVNTWYVCLRIISCKILFWLIVNK